MYAEKTEYMTTNKAGVFASWVCSPLVDMDSARYGVSDDYEAPSIGDCAGRRPC